MFGQVPSPGPPFQCCTSISRAWIGTSGAKNKGTKGHQGQPVEELKNQGRTDFSTVECIIQGFTVDQGFPKFAVPPPGSAGRSRLRVGGDIVREKDLTGASEKKN